MRWRWTQLLSLLLFLSPSLFILGSLMTLGVASDGDDNIHLHVSVEGSRLRRVPAYVPRFSQIQLVNMHPTDPVRVFSIEPIERSSSSDNRVQFIEVNDDLLPQVLSPGQAAHIPLVFLPRGNGTDDPPELKQDRGDNNNPDSSSSTSPSYEEDPDLEDNLKLYEAILQVRTSRGTARALFKASSTPSNPYKIDSNPRFFLHSDDKNLTSEEHNKDSSRGRFEIYMTNPSPTEELRVIEIFSTEPDWIRIEYETSEFLSEKLKLMEGPLKIPPERRVFIATVYIDYDARSSDSMRALVPSNPGTNSGTMTTVIWGYIHIRTNMDGLALPVEVSLDWEEGERSNRDVRNNNHRVSSFPSNVRAKREGESGKLKGDSSDTGDDGTEDENSDDEKQDGDLPAVDNSKRRDTVLVAVPPIADFGVLTNEDDIKSRNKSLGISLVNQGDIPMRIVEVVVRPLAASAAKPNPNSRSNTSSDKNVANANDQQKRSSEPVAVPSLTWALQSSLPISGGTNSVNQGGIIVPPRGELKPAIVLKCSTIVRTSATAGSWRTAQRHWGSISIQAVQIENPEVTETVEVPYVATVIPGYIGYDRENLFFLMNPDNSSMEGDLASSTGNSTFSGSERRKKSRRGKGNNKEEVNMRKEDNIYSQNSSHTLRRLNFTNHFPVGLSVRSMELDKGCNNLFELGNLSSVVGAVVRPEQTWGSVSLKFIPRNLREQDGTLNMTYFPFSCSLVLRTNVDIHRIPIVVYSDHLLVTMPPKATPATCRDSFEVEDEGQQVTSEAPSSTPSTLNDVDARDLCKTWWGSSPAANNLRTAQRRLGLPQFLNESDGQDSRRPVLLSFGAIGAGEVETRSIFLTNLNPLPVTVKATVSVLEGLEITLGRTAANVLDFLPSTFQSDSKAGNSSTTARQFLKQGKSFFPDLRWQNDVSFSKIAGDDLKELYQKHAVVQLFRDINRPSKEFFSEFVASDAPPLSNNSSINDNLNEGSFSLGNDSDGILFSLDGEYEYRLNSLFQNDRILKQKQWSIPPGAVARFDVHVRAPPEFMLKQDITSFIASGLELLTGTERIPLVITYEALLGQLRLTPMPPNEKTRGSILKSKSSTDSINDVHIYNYTNVDVSDCELNSQSNLGVCSKNCNLSPAEISSYGRNDRYRKLSLPITLRPFGGSNGGDLDPSVDPRHVPLYMESTFSNDFILHEIESCNKWFTVKMNSSCDLPNECDFDANHSNETNKGRNSAFTGLDANSSNISCDVGVEGDCKKNNIHVNGEKLSSATVRMKIKAHSSAVPIGQLFSTISCRDGNNFFACAMELLEHREAIQPIGCGKLISNSVANKREKEVKTRAIGTLKEAVMHLSSRYESLEKGDHSGSHPAPIFEETPELHTESGSKDKLTFGATTVFYKLAENKQQANLSPSSVKASGADGTNNSASLIPRATVKKFEAAIDAWNQVTKLGLNRISTNVRAKTSYLKSLSQSNSSSIDYKSDEIGKKNTRSGYPEDTNSLMISVQDLMVQADLTIPQINDAVDRAVDFGVTHIGKVAKKFIYITNPAAFSIKIKIAAEESDHTSSVGATSEDNSLSSSLFVQHSASERHPWWTGGNYWMADLNGNLIQSNHNVTIKSGGGAFVSLVNPSLHASSAFILGCGKRCGLRNEVSNAEKMQAPIGASAASGARLAEGIIMNSRLPPAFALAYRGLQEIEVPPYGKAMLGPVYFRPPSRELFESNIYLENSLNGLEKVTLKGSGGWEKLAFLENDQSSYSPSETAGIIELRMGSPTLVFPGTAKLDGSPVVKAVTVANQGDVTIDISNIYMGTGEILYFTNLKPHPTKSMLRDMQSRRFMCEKRGFRLVACRTRVPNAKDMPLSSIGNGIVLWFSSFLGSYIPSDIFSVEERGNLDVISSNDVIIEEEDLTDGFTLLPGQNKTLYIEHIADCTFRTMYASLNLEYSGRKMSGSWEKEFRRRKAELLVGYDMNKLEMKACKPTTSKSNSLFLSYSNSRMNNRRQFTQLAMILSFCFVLGNILYWFFYRHRNASSFRSMLVSTESISQDQKTQEMLDFSLNNVNSTISSNSWSASFRCLARTDPSSADLVYLGKEQTKHILLSKYRKLAILPPHCVLTNGEFVREYPSSNIARNGGGGNAVASGSSATVGITGRVSNSGTNHFMTMTDAIFGGNIDSEGCCDYLMPIGLRWRVAVSKKIVQPHDGLNFTCGDLGEGEYSGSKVKDLLLKRLKAQSSDDSSTLLKQMNGEINLIDALALLNSNKENGSGDTNGDDVHTDDHLDEESAHKDVDSVKSDEDVLSEASDADEKTELPVKPSYTKSNLVVSLPTTEMKISTEKNGKQKTKDLKTTLHINMKKQRINKKPMNVAVRNGGKEQGLNRDKTKVVHTNIDTSDRTHGTNQAWKKKGTLHFQRAHKSDRPASGHTVHPPNSATNVMHRKPANHQQQHVVDRSKRAAAFPKHNQHTSGKKWASPALASNIERKHYNEVSSHQSASPRSSSSSGTAASRISSLSLSDGGTFLSSPPASPTITSPKLKVKNLQVTSRDDSNNAFHKSLPSLPIDDDEGPPKFTPRAGKLPQSLSLCRSRSHDGNQAASDFSLFQNRTVGGAIRPPPGLPPPPPGFSKDIVNSDSADGDIPNSKDELLTAVLLPLATTSGLRDDVDILPPVDHQINENESSSKRSTYLPVHLLQSNESTDEVGELNNSVSHMQREVKSGDGLTGVEQDILVGISPLLTDQSNPVVGQPLENQGSVSAIGSGTSKNISTSLGTELRMSSGTSDGGLDSMGTEIPLLGFGGGFNVENFLDGILNDSTPVETEGNTTDRWDASSGAVLPISQNENREIHRAMAYSIAVGGPVVGGEKSSSLNVTQSGNLGITLPGSSELPTSQLYRECSEGSNNIPLLTPSILRKAASEGTNGPRRQDDNGSAKDDDYFGGDSFLASLVGE